MLQSCVTFFIKCLLARYIRVLLPYENVYYAHKTEKSNKHNAMKNTSLLTFSYFEAILGLRKLNYPHTYIFFNVFIGDREIR